MNKKEKILIVGAGLCGSLLALRMAQRGYQVEVYESRSDLRNSVISAGRSINLSLSDRGLKALRMAGLEKKARALCIPMKGRLMHDAASNTFESNYSGRQGECINSISRGNLNGLLLTEAEKYPNVNIHFNTKCLEIDIESKIARFQSFDSKEQFTVQADVIFGTDGAGSSLRKSYEKQFPAFKVSQEFLTHGYKELEIPADKNGGHLISKEHLHIWPRGDYMLIALPNMDGSFTVTLFLSYSEGSYNFDNLITKEKIIEFFEKDFPDTLALIPDVLKEFENNPTGKLGTVKCYPWAYKGNTLLLGDSSHAIVPFYGQGMNASFEDVFVFDSVLNQFEGDWATVFSEFQKQRKIDADAIADLAIDNYYEMRDHVANPLFKEKRIVEMGLEKFFPTEYFSKYSLVTFNEHIGYHEAMTKGRAQDKVLLKMVEESKFSASPKTTKEEMTILLEKVQEETNKLLK
ncbi:FAD-dependent monooxygenase [Flavobacteriaceae bacterium]|jgi:kynurenine 3-monooxygenase|nr:FAD-dependent monooxygenase [Flavobacteriaceae bacterium]MDB4228484.1 FAD-dependent monooxygenase [Flavobacteriaceae bacterium]MDB4236468.1 FAD-dependent monooxygenase [Flavobacteriaceae bacterium]MDB9893091.1 FAD-dependent monooxygenase [Flavobacteriaceae bacterium]MDC1342861.1 FAD-dependent monooxygenase [Flavobacteriaceae bacterium]|tara:strand:- start:11366 stop:12751 length:1386 start_codon:yes stop_codon:yes gene_type:complete